MHIRLYYILWILITIIYVGNLTLDVMEVDAAQYASMAIEMQESGNYLHVYHRGEDYLDKPPLLFWLSATSFSLFGVSNFAYKLPALLALLLGLWSTYRFVLLYDKQETALMATSILATTQALFLMTNDVRTDGLLTGCVMFAVYQLAAYLQKQRWHHLMLAGIGVGLAMLAKGPIGAIIPIIALAIDRLLKGRWKELFNVRWGIVILVALLVLAPMCYGLYTQFDLHPEKTAYGLEGPSGLRFFFWTQSFGRITGEIYWDNNAPFYFFLLTFLWDFMPWVIIFFFAFGSLIREGWRKRTAYPEYFSAGGLVLVAILLSFSQYKLPHYIFPLFPFAAILTARYLVDKLKDSGRGVALTQFFLMHMFYGVVVYVFVKAFPPENIVVPLLVAIAYIVLWLAYLKLRQPTFQIFAISCITAVTFNLFMAFHFYPHLLQYQAGIKAGALIREDKRQHERLYFTYPTPSYSVDFYARGFVPVLSDSSLLNVPAGSWVYIAQEEDLQQVRPEVRNQFKVVREFENYHVSMLTLKFLRKETRETVLKNAYLLEKQ